MRNTNEAPFATLMIPMTINITTTLSRTLLPSKSRKLPEAYTMADAVVAVLKALSIPIIKIIRYYRKMWCNIGP